MVRRKDSVFFWIPRIEDTNYQITINGTDETSHVTGAKWTDAIIGEESGFEVQLENNNDRFTTLYSGNETVDFFLEFSSSSPTKRFTGKIEDISKQHGGRGNIITIKGTHRFHSDLLDITVTASYAGSTGDAILKDLIANNLSTSYTTTNVKAVTDTPTLKWENVPFYDAVVDICEACNCDAYVDVNQDFHFFKRESIENTDEAVVAGDNWITTNGLTTDVIKVKNKVLVASEDDEGLPILYTAENKGSQTQFGIKELVLKESNLTDVSQAKEIAEFKIKSDPQERGKTQSFMLPSMAPGQLIWVVVPNQDIAEEFRIVKFSHRLFSMTTECVIAESKDLPHFLKERKQREAALAKLKNPNKMLYSFNLPFDNEDDIATKDTNVTVTNGEIFLASGTEGTFTTVTHNAPITASSVHLQAVGESLTGTVFKISTDGTEPSQKIEIDELTTLSKQGKDIRLKVEFNSANTIIKSLALLYK